MNSTDVDNKSLKYAVVETDDDCIHDRTFSFMKKIKGMFDILNIPEVNFEKVTNYDICVYFMYLKYKHMSHKFCKTDLERRIFEDSNIRKTVANKIG